VIRKTASHRALTSGACLVRVELLCCEDAILGARRSLVLGPDFDMLDIASDTLGRASCNIVQQWHNDVRRDKDILPSRLTACVISTNGMPADVIPTGMVPIGMEVIGIKLIDVKSLGEKSTGVLYLGEWPGTSVMSPYESLTSVYMMC
jgi:hypothetical protein